MSALPSSPADALADDARGAVWQVRLLGAFEIDDGRQRLTRLRSRAAMALLARVALAPTRDHAREELAGLLWPEADDETGRKRLRQTLSLLKAVLEPPGGPPVLQADRRVLRAVPGALWCDATAFEQALQQGRSAQAQALYRGELLPGFYDEWVLDERRRLQALADRLGPPGPAPGRIPPPLAPVPVPAPMAAARLPQYLTRLVGADQAGARLLAMVAEHRLVSVLGPGGCGKTRLAVEVAHLAIEPAAGTAARAAFDSALFVSAVDVVSATQLLDRLQLALRADGTADRVDTVLAALLGRRSLLLLDNAEALDDEAVALLARLAERAPQVHWLVTSRRATGLDGERIFALDSLPLPAPGTALAALVLNPAIALFIDRARAHRPDFHVGASNHEPLQALVRWLDGLPLAIELAASHARSLGPAELLALLRAARDRADGGSLALLSRRGQRSGSDPRHASMLGVVAGSWQLLEPAQQQLLGALATLPSGARLGLACALAAPDALGRPPTPVQVQGLLDALVAHSVLRVQTSTADDAARYSPYEPVREYALAQQSAPTLRQHRTHLRAGLLAWARDMPATPPLPAVREEMPQLLHALDTARDDGEAGDAVNLVLLLQSSWGEIAVPEGALQALDRLLETPGLDDSLAAAGHAFAAWCCQEAGRPEAARHHMAAAESRPCPDATLRAMVTSRLARLHWRLDRNIERTRACIEQALALARQLGRFNTEAAMLSLQAHLSTVIDREPARGAELSAQALALWQRSDNRHLINAGRYNVAVNRIKAGQAAQVLDELAALALEGLSLQDWDLASGALEARGSALLGLRRWAEAAAELRESVRVAWAGLHMLALVHALWNVAPALARQQQPELAAEVMGMAEALWRQRFGAFDVADRRDLRRMRRFARAQLGAAAAQLAWQRGAARPLGELVRAVLAR